MRIFASMRHKSVMKALMTMLWLLLALPTTATVNFRTINVKDGLADNFVRDIMTDSEGYIWLSTINGVSRYDGYRFLNFQPKQWGGRTGDVSMVRETADHTLWMLITSGELFTYRRDEQKWQMDGIERLSAMGIKGNTIRSFYVDDDGGLWVATEYGLWHQDFQRPSGEQTFSPALKTDPIARPILHIVAKNGTTLIITTDYYIYKVSASGKLTLLTNHPKPGNDDRDSHAMLDSRMNLWLYHAHESAGALWVWSLSNNEWRQPEVLNRLGSHITVNAIAEDSNGRLWVSTGNQGIFISEEGTQKLNFPHVTCFYADRNNTMWAGSAKLGAAYADLNSPEFIHITNEGHDDVSALIEDAQGNIWIGFDGEGIIRQGKDGATRTFSALQGQLSSDNVTALTIDGQGHILVGTYGGGIAQFNGDQFTPLYEHIDQLRYVKALIYDRHGSYWVATVDKGVVRITDNRFTNYTAKNSPLRSDGIICLAYDAPADRMYIGTSIGLAAYDCSQGGFVKDDMIDSLKDISVTSLLVDDDGRLWIGSRNGLWIKDRTLRHLTTEQGLTHNVVRALAMSAGTLWASTDNGLTSITIQDDDYKCRPFFDSDGLQGIIFSNNAALTTHDGTVLLGSLTGYISIGPERLQVNNGSAGMIPSSLKVAFTEFRINGNPVVKSPQDFTINYGERLGVSISMMVPALSHKTRYLYRFKGEEEWMRAPSNMLYFASLMPGTHVLQVKAELTGMTTTDVSELTFHVLRPLWLSNWAIAGYLLLFSALVWIVWRAIRRRQKRELAMKQMELNLRKYEMEEQKISFFTNISHDIKTPLTMVMAPLEKIRDATLPTAIRTEIDVAWQNARQLYDLVLELLDFRRLDEGKEQLKLSHGELVSFVRRNVHSFDYIAKRRNITIKFQLPSTPIEMSFDENKMRRILTNLLSNAFKYNVENGTVTVSLNQQDNEIQLSVADTGIGIKDKQSIFERFVQETHGQEQEGSGLGLHIVRQYVDMMGGTIMVTDNKPAGTVFTVTIPTAITDIPKDEDAMDKTEHPVTETAPVKQPPTILVVEDNTDARLFLQRSLEDEYRILSAANGKEAFSLLGKNDQVNLIISDVMMPVMDGIEFVRQLRQNIRYSHIPVILLTAKSGEEDIIAGLEEGVADYLTKPYSLAVLRLRIKKILEWTKHIYEQVATGIEITPSEITVSSLDEELISQVIAEVEANITDPTYSVVQLSSAVGMTRGTLYKKLMAIVGKSPVEFIRIVRLKRAKSLLEQGRTNISEVADAVGFSPKMFAQYFRETFGETPSEYLKHQKSKNKKYDN